MAKNVPAPAPTKDSKPRILSCGCNSPYQDRQYGEGQRLMNRNKDGYSCTGCNRKVTMK